jgi:hypothetical protein
MLSSFRFRKAVAKSFAYAVVVGLFSGRPSRETAVTLLV